MLIKRLPLLFQSLGIGTYYMRYYLVYLLAFSSAVLLLFLLRKRLKPWVLKAGVFFLFFLLVRTILFGNPISFHHYLRALRPDQLGMRQYDAIVQEIAKYRRNVHQRPRLRYLAVGSSQVGVIFHSWNSDQPDSIRVFSLAGMRTVDYVLNQNYIAGYEPDAIILFLSGLDLALLPDLSSMNLAPGSPETVWPVMKRLAQYGLLSGPYATAIHEYLVAQLLPEYRYSFIFREWLRQRLEAQAQHRKRSASGHQTERGVYAPVMRVTWPAVRIASGISRERIEHFERSYEAQWMGLYQGFLEDFLSFCGTRNIRVIIVEGQVNPVAWTAKVRGINDAARRTFASLEARYPHVKYIPAGDVYEFGVSDYADLVHVTADAARRYTQRLGDYLHCHPELAGRANASLYNFSSQGWLPMERDGENWNRWSDGSGALRLRARVPAEVVLEGEVLASARPNRVQILLNSREVFELKIDTLEWQFYKIGPLSLRLAGGENVIRFVSREPPMKGADQQLRSLLVRNLSLRESHQARVCEAPPCPLAPPGNAPVLSSKTI